MRENDGNGNDGTRFHCVLKVPQKATVTQKHGSLQDWSTSIQVPQGWNKTWKVIINHIEIPQLGKKQYRIKSNLFVESHVHFSGSGCFFFL
jgi:hypothetical protein